MKLVKQGAAIPSCLAVLSGRASVWSASSQVDQCQFHRISALIRTIIVGMTTFTAFEADIVVVCQGKERVDGLDDGNPMNTI